MNRREAHREAMRIAYHTLESQDAIGIGEGWTHEDAVKIEKAFTAIVQQIYERWHRLKTT